MIRAFAVCDRIVDEVCLEKQCPLIDMHAELSGRSEFFFDHIYFSDQGGKRAAKIVAKYLAEIID